MTHNERHNMGYYCDKNCFFAVFSQDSETVLINNVYSDYIVQSRHASMSYSNIKYYRHQNIWEEFTRRQVHKTLNIKTHMAEHGTLIY